MYVIISIQRWSWLVGSYFGLLFYGQQKVYFDYYKQNYPVSRIIDNKEVAVVQGHFYRHGDECKVSGLSDLKRLEA